MADQKTSNFFGSCRHVSPDDCLNSFHISAAVSNIQNYFGCFLDENSRFLGTDASENWSSVEFLEYSRNAFATPTAWEYTYVEGSRKLTSVLDGQVICFDELLHSKSFHCTTRGSGTLIKHNTYWFITQYHLSFPTPNDLAHIMCKQIELYEANQHKPKNIHGDDKLKMNVADATKAAEVAADALLKELDEERAQQQQISKNKNHSNHTSNNNTSKNKGKSKK